MRFITYTGEMYDDNKTEAGRREMEVNCCKFLYYIYRESILLLEERLFYVKRYTIIPKISPQ